MLVCVKNNCHGKSQKFCNYFLIIGNFLREDDLIVEPLRFEDGYALVPQTPGLGVMLDEEAVRKYRVT